MNTGEGSGFVAPGNGTELSQGAVEEIETQVVEWNGGPAYGEVRYRASANFSWIYGVNIVEIKISQAMGTNQIIFNSDPTQDENVFTLIHSNKGKASIKAYLQVERIRGPEFGGKMRGVKFMELGFIQNLTVTTNHADYDFSEGNEDDKSVQRENVGETYIDGDWDGSGAKPWYDPTGGHSEPGAVAKFAPSQDQEYTNISFMTLDSPKIKGTNSNVLTVGNEVDLADRYDLQIDFTLYLGVHTKEEVFEDVYIQLAKANWKFNGSGTLDDDSKWTPSANTKTNGDSEFTIMTGGKVPVVDGPWAVPELREADWIVVDQLP